MKYGPLFTIFSIGMIGFCLTNQKQEPQSTGSEKTCYVAKKKNAQKTKAASQSSVKTED